MVSTRQRAIAEQNQKKRHGVPIRVHMLGEFENQLRTADISVSSNMGDGDMGGGAYVNCARYRSFIVTSKSRISAACRERSSLLLRLSLRSSNRRDKRSSTPDAGVDVPALAATSRKLGSTGLIDLS
jgi:hypothetical protein